MNPKLKLFLRKCQYPLTLALGFYPLLMIVNGSFAPSLVELCAIFPAFYVVWAILCMALPGKLRYWIGVLGALLLCTPVFFLPGPVIRWIALGNGVVYAIILMCSLPIAKWTETDELPNGIMWAGMVLQIGAQIIQATFSANKETQMSTTSPWLMVSLLVYVLLAMLSMNRKGLLSASTGRQAVPGTIRRRNLLLLLLLFGGAVLLATLPFVAKLIETGCTAFIGMIIVLILLGEPQSGEAEATNPTEAERPDMVSPGTEGTGSFMEVLFEFLAYTALIVAVICILIFLWRRCKKWLPKLWQRISKHYNASTEDYVDEITSTREFGVLEKHKEKAAKVSRFRQRSLPPRQQIRVRYQAILKKHPEWAAGSTAREKLPASASPLYERARYSSHPISQEEAQTFRENTKKI